MPRWLITGGCGFIGTALIRRLKRAGGHEIRVLDNLTVGTRVSLVQISPFREIRAGATSTRPFQGFELMVGDIREKAVVIEAMTDVDLVVHLAANTGVPQSFQDPEHDCMVNIVGTLNCLEAARMMKATRVVFASSSAPLGDVVPPIHEEIAAKPVSPYGASKLAGEAYCSAYGRAFGLQTISLRFGNVYGPGSSHKSSVVATFIKQALDGQPLTVYGDGKQTRDFIFIDDLVDALFAAAECAGVGEVFQIASQRETTIAEIADLIKEHIDRLNVAPSVIIRYGTVRPGDVRRSYSDITKAKRVLGWEPKISLADGIHRTIEWFVAERCRAGAEREKGPA